MLPPMYHFTSADSACCALEVGLELAVDPEVRRSIVWLSPNVYSWGSPGSVFGAIGLKVRADFVAGFAPKYVGTKPEYSARHRFVLVRHGQPLPDNFTERDDPPTNDDAPGSREYILLEPVPASDINGIRFVKHCGCSPEHSDAQHRRFFAYLLATQQHALVGTLDYPHSTEPAVGGGWRLFTNLRQWLVNGASNNGVVANSQATKDVLQELAKTGEGAALLMLCKLEAQSLWTQVTEAYRSSYDDVACGRSLDLADDTLYTRRPRAL